jgi:hypothetical protein
VRWVREKRKKKKRNGERERERVVHRIGKKGKRKERIRWDTCYHMDGLEKMR